MSTFNGHRSLENVPAHGAAEEQSLMVHGVEKRTLELPQPQIGLSPEPPDPLDPLGVSTQYPPFALEPRVGVSCEGGEQVRVLFQNVTGIFVRSGGSGLSEVTHAVPLHCCVTASPC